MKWLKSRLFEPSTWAGLGTLAAVLGFPMAAPIFVKAGALAGAIGAIVLAEGNK